MIALTHNPIANLEYQVVIKCEGAPLADQRPNEDLMNRIEENDQGGTWNTVSIQHTPSIVITLKLEGINIVVNCSSPIAAPFLLCFLVPEILSPDLQSQRSIKLWALWLQFSPRRIT